MPAPWDQIRPVLPGAFKSNISNASLSLLYMQSTPSKRKFDFAQISHATYSSQKARYGSTLTMDYTTQIIEKIQGR